MGEKRDARKYMQASVTEAAEIKGYDAEGQKRRTATYLQHQEAKGLVQCKVWVPTDAKDELRKYASELRAVRRR